MSQSEQAIVRHLSGFFAALDAFVQQAQAELDTLKEQLDKTKQ